MVRRHQKSIAVTAPAGCSLERLFYFGSEKGEDDIGQFGEGFKVAAVCLLHDHQLSPLVASGEQVMSLRIGQSAVGESRSMFPVEYDFTELPNRLRERCSSYPTPPPNSPAKWKRG